MKNCQLSFHSVARNTWIAEPREGSLIGKKPIGKRKYIWRGYYTVARGYEFYFRVAKQYFTNELRSFVKYWFGHEKINFISSSRRVMFFLLYRQKDRDKIINFYSPKSKTPMRKMTKLRQKWQISHSDVFRSLRYSKCRTPHLQNGR